MIAHEVTVYEYMDSVSEQHPPHATDTLPLPVPTLRGTCCGLSRPDPDSGSDQREVWAMVMSNEGHRVNLLALKAAER